MSRESYSEDAGSSSSLSATEPSTPRPTHLPAAYAVYANANANANASTPGAMDLTLARPPQPPSSVLVPWLTSALRHFADFLFWPFIGGIMYGTGELVAREMLKRRMGGQQRVIEDESKGKREQRQ